MSAATLLTQDALDDDVRLIDVVLDMNLVFPSQVSDANILIDARHLLSHDDSGITYSYVVCHTRLHALLKGLTSPACMPYELSPTSP